MTDAVGIVGAMGAGDSLRDGYAVRTFIFFCLTLQDSQYRLKLSQ